MFNTFFVHAYGWYGGLNKEHAISLQWGPKIHLKTSWHKPTYRKFFVQSSTPSPSMHQKLTLHEFLLCAKQPTPYQIFG
jgi:hypothetical protein